MVTWNSDMLAVLRRAGLLELGPPPPMEPLEGGVSSDIWRITIGNRQYCVKRALPKLKVSADWRAPVERSRYEAAWIEVAEGIAPDAVPVVVHFDELGSAIVMRYLHPDSHEIWKDRLREGKIDASFAAAVGSVLARIHSATARSDEIAGRFASDAIFQAIRIEPYLLATAAVHKPVGRQLRELARRTAQTKQALIHGDVSPKNILVGPRGPVLLDAECATYGDPAFDIAFCLNHLLLKSIWRPLHTARYLAAFEAMESAYLSALEFDGAEEVEERAASLLPGLLLGRIDGKSPVEYITDPTEKGRVRRIALAFLEQPPTRLGDIREAWREEIQG